MLVSSGTINQPLFYSSNYAFWTLINIGDFKLYGFNFKPKKTPTNKPKPKQNTTSKYKTRIDMKPA